MSRFKNVFPKKHTLIAVVHCVPEGKGDADLQVLRNVAIAQEHGADGVFLIAHGDSFMELFRWYRSARKAFPNFWIGVNALDLTPCEVFQHAPETVQGIWADSLGTRNDIDCVQIGKRRERSMRLPDTLYFGGVAFKGPQYEDDPNVAGKLAVENRPFVDVITTSGSRTGTAPTVEKIIVMKEAIGDFPLAIASGIAITNVQQFMAADCFVVATSLCKKRSFTEFDFGAIKAFTEIISPLTQEKFRTTEHAWI